MIFLSAQHSNNTKHIKWLLNKYLKHRQHSIEYAHYAMLYDRLQMLMNEKQRYGTQSIINTKTGIQYYYLIEDKKRINEFRKYCCYDTLEDDMKFLNMDSFRESTTNEQNSIFKLFYSYPSFKF